MKNTLHLLLVSFTLCLGLVIKSNAQNYSWTQKANFPGIARAYDVGFSIGDFGYIGLGYDGSSYYDDFYKWDQAKNTWSAIADYPGAGRYEPTGMTIEGKGYVGLGWTGSAGATDFWSYDTATKTWTQMATFTGKGRYGASVFVIGHKAFVMGGSTYSNDVWMYDAHQNTWKHMNNCPQGDIEGMSSFAIGNYGYTGGGWNGSNLLNTFWQYDTTTDTWSSVATIPLPGGLGGTPQEFVFGSRAYVCAAATVPNATTLSDGYVYDTSTKAWSVFTNMGTNGIERDYATAFAIGLDGYIGTGIDSNGVMLSSFWQYGPTNMEGINQLKEFAPNISIYPNPSKGIMNLAYSGNSKKEELRITDLMGRVLNSYEIIGTKGQIGLNETSLSDGMYFYQVIDSGKLVSSGKFIIEKQ
jgi:N-acetylneuraminic acid mutarotase